jgi:hypothetical protein
LTDNFKKVIDAKSKFNGFIKITDEPLTTLTSEQKAVLNRKGNILFNQGNLEQAKRIFMTTGYSDGLTRIADKYNHDKQELKALKLYVLAHNKKKAEPLYEKIAGIVSVLLHE